MEPLILLGIAVLFFFLFSYFVPLTLWITAKFSGVEISLMELIFMRIRRGPVNELVNSFIMCSKAGLDIDLIQLETYALAGGNITTLTQALITAKKDNMPVTFADLQAQGLAGHDLKAYLHQRKLAGWYHVNDLRKSLCRKIIE